MVVLVIVVILIMVGFILANLPNQSNSGADRKSETIETKLPTAPSTSYHPEPVTDEHSEPLQRNNFWINFPKKLSNGQTLHKEYIKNDIEPAVSVDEYNKLILGEPLTFAEENKEEHTVAAYQGETKIGYLKTKTACHAVSDSLEKGNCVFGFLSHIDPYADLLKMKIAYYKDQRKEKTDLGFDDSAIIEELRDKATNIIEYTKKGEEEPYHKQKVPMERNGKKLYYLDKEFSLYIHDKDDPKYDFSTLKLGAHVSIKREPSNPYDKKAVVVKQGNNRIGYLYDDTQHLVNQLLTSGGSAVGNIVDFDTSGKKVKIIIALALYK